MVEAVGTEHAGSAERAEARARGMATKGAAGLLPAVLLLGCMARPGAPPAPAAFEPPAPPGGEPAVRVRVDSARSLVVMEAGPFRIPSGSGAHSRPGGHAEHGETTPLLPFEWPVDGWYRGFRVRLVDQAGDTLSQGLLHHLIGVNFDRRQLVYPVPERFLGVGTETGDILLPERFGVPMARGSRLGIYASWQNETGESVEGAYIQVALSFMPREPGVEPEAVVPIYMDTNNRIGATNAWNLPPGRAVRSHEFELPVDGALLGLSGHLHDYGRSVRLEDAETGRVLVELDAIVDEADRLVGVEQRIFRRLFGLLDARIPMERGRRYRVVGEYLNPTGRTIEMGAMAHLSGVFAPAHMGSWTAIDTASVSYRNDVAGLPVSLGDGR